jgi:hypothetical protein
MSFAVEDYTRIVDRFIRDLAALGEDLASVYLYGSVARGEVKPGKSDVGDAYVFLRQGVLEDRAAFFRALETMTEAYRALASAGLPSHPHHYYGLDELRYIAAGALSTLLSEQESRLVAGQDLHTRFVEPLRVETAMHELLREMAYAYARYLARDELTEQERKELVAAVAPMWKYVALWIRAATGATATGETPSRTIERLFPDIDRSVVDEVAALREPGAALPSSAEIRELLRRCLVLIEELHARILARV